MAATIYLFTFMASLFSLLYLAKLFKNMTKWHGKKKNLPPSPSNSLPILGHLHLLKKPLHHSLTSLASMHGPLLYLRFGTRPVLVVSSAHLAEECFTVNDLTFANRPIFPSFKLFSYNNSTLGTVPYGPLWRDLRRVATTEVLSSHRLSTTSGFRAAEVRALARRLFRDSSHVDSAIVELRPHLFELSFNVIMKLIAGEQSCAELSDDGVDVRRFRENIQESFLLLGASNIGDFLPSLFGWLARRGLEKKWARIHGYRDAFIQSLIEKHRKRVNPNAENKGAEDSSETMIDAILSLQKTHQEQFSDKFIKSIIMSLLLAATDTVSTTLEWAMSLLLNDPEKMEKLRKEIDERAGHGLILQESDLPKLPYLNCVISETLRMFPPGPLLVPHKSSEECRVGGYDVPGGTILLVNAYMIQRDPEMWPEPAMFLPERFLGDGQPAGAGKMYPFGMGRRRCPGEGLAMREVGLALGILIQCFDWRRVGSGEPAVDMEEGPGLTMPRANPLRAVCMPKQAMISILSQL